MKELTNIESQYRGLRNAWVIHETDILANLGLMPVRDLLELSLGNKVLVDAIFCWIALFYCTSIQLSLCWKAPVLALSIKLLIVLPIP